MSSTITTEEAAKELGVTRQRVRVLIRCGRLKASQIGSGNRATYFIERSALEAVRVRVRGRPRKI